MQESLLKLLIEPKLMRILNAILDEKDELFTLQKIASKSNVANATTFRLMKRLLKAGVVKQVKIGKLKLYKADEKIKGLK